MLHERSQTHESTRLDSIYVIFWIKAKLHGQQSDQGLSGAWEGIGYKEQDGTLCGDDFVLLLESGGSYYTTV